MGGLCNNDGKNKTKRRSHKCVLARKAKCGSAPDEEKQGRR
jgi:hypothetical protein